MLRTTSLAADQLPIASGASIVWRTPQCPAEPSKCAQLILVHGPVGMGIDRLSARELDTAATAGWGFGTPKIEEQSAGGAISPDNREVLEWHDARIFVSHCHQWAKEACKALRPKVAAESSTHRATLVLIAQAR